MRKCLFGVVICGAALSLGAAEGAPRASACVAEPSPACVLDLAVEAAGRIEEAAARDLVLQGIATAFAEVGAVKRALETAALVSSPYYRAPALGAAGASRFRSGYQGTARRIFETAVETALLIEAARARGRVLKDIAEARAAAGDLDGARATIERIKFATARVEALQGLAAALGRSGALSAARETLDRARHIALAPDIRAAHPEALAKLAHAQIESGDFDGALASARAIDWIAMRASVLRVLAAALARTGDTSGAMALARDLEDKSARASVLEAVATALVERGEDSAARPVYAAALDAARAADSPGWRAVALAGVARGMAVGGAATTAREAFEEALGEARAIDSSGARAGVLRKICGALIKANYLDQALATARTIGPDAIRAGALRAVAAAQNPVRSGQTFGAAIDAAMKLEDPVNRAWLMGDIAAAWARAGNTESALATADTIQDRGGRVKALRDVALALIETGHAAPARRALAEALATALAIEAPSARAWALHAVGTALIQVP